MNLLTQPVGVSHYLVVGAILFVSGVVCMATKRNALGVLMGIELVLNGANVNFVAFGSEFLQAESVVFDRAGWPIDRPVRDRAGRGRSGRGPGHHAELLQQPFHGRRRSGGRTERLMEPRSSTLPDAAWVLAWLLAAGLVRADRVFRSADGQARQVCRLCGDRRDPDRLRALARSR